MEKKVRYRIGTNVDGSPVVVEHTLPVQDPPEQENRNRQPVVVSKLQERASQKPQKLQRKILKPNKDFTPLPS